MPDYEIKRWSTENFDIHSVRLTEEAFNARKWAFAADYIRVYALYTEGGIYLDSDVMLYGDLSKLLDSDFVSAVEYHPTMSDKITNKERLNSDFERISKELKVLGTGIQAAVLASVPGHPLMKRCKDFYETLTLDRLLANRYTAPTVIGYNSEIYGFRYVDREQRLKENIHLYPTTIISNFDQKNKKSLAVHWCAGSWGNRTAMGRLKHWLNTFYVYRKIRDTLKSCFVKG